MSEIGRADDDQTSLDGAMYHPSPHAETADAGEFAAIWNANTPDRREELHRALIRDRRVASQCFMQGHDMDRLELGRLQITVRNLSEQVAAWASDYRRTDNVRARLANDVKETVGYIDRTLDVGERHDSTFLFWRNDEVMTFLRDLRSMLDG